MVLLDYGCRRHGAGAHDLRGVLLVADTGTLLILFFFFSSRRRHTRSDRDWSSDVCSSDLEGICASRRRSPSRETGIWPVDLRNAVLMPCTLLLLPLVAPPCARLVCRGRPPWRSEEHTSELQSRSDLVCRLLLEKKKKLTEELFKKAIGVDGGAIRRFQAIMVSGVQPLPDAGRASVDHCVEAPLLSLTCLVTGHV